MAYERRRDTRSDDRCTDRDQCRGTSLWVTFEKERYREIMTDDGMETGPRKTKRRREERKRPTTNLSDLFEEMSSRADKKDESGTVTIKTDMQRDWHNAWKRTFARRSERCASE